MSHQFHWHWPGGKVDSRARGRMPFRRCAGGDVLSCHDSTSQVAQRGRLNTVRPHHHPEPARPPACRTNTRPMKLSRRFRMRFSLNLGRRLSPMVIALALLGGAATTAGAGTWGQDFDISGGDVNDTFTSSNGQRFACVNATNDPLHRLSTTGTRPSRQQPRGSISGASSTTSAPRDHAGDGTPGESAPARRSRP
jgi:hypothetical protein